VVLVAAIWLAFAGTARAQNDAGGALVDILFGPNAEGALDLDVVAALGLVLPAEATTFPLASSSGGFTWTFDPALGVQTRRTQSFGPMFAERPFTNGMRKFNVGVAFQHTAYDSLAGQQLSALQSVIRPAQVAAFDLQRTYSSQLSFKTDRTIISASYGVHNRIDVGVLIPIEYTRASGSTNSTLTVLAVPAGQCAEARTRANLPSAPLCRSAAQGAGDISVPSGICVVGSRSGSLLCPFASSGITGTSNGLGDVTVRGKFAALSSPMMDLGVGIDVRLPTGDEDKLLGLGKAQTRVMVMGSTTRGSVAPHFNVGYTFSGSGIPFVDTASGPRLDFNSVFTEDGNVNLQPSPEINYTVGVDVAASSSVTIMGDVIGRSLRNSAVFDFTTQGASSFFTVSPGTLNLILGTVGTKIKVGNEYLVLVSVVFPLNSAGIKPGITPVVGIERAF
jgi:hypothetical protein